MSTTSRKPPWLRVPLAAKHDFARVAGVLADLRLNTVCAGAKCPNRCECHDLGTATFMILGDVCTRRCTFCGVDKSRPPAPPDPDESKRVAEAARRLRLSHVVATSVTRDDLPDGGAGLFAALVSALRALAPTPTIETLIPDFAQNQAAWTTVFAARPDVLNHNVETVPRLYATVRPKASYAGSLDLLAAAHDSGLYTKSGFMVGLGETDDEIRDLLRDLAAAGVQAVTIGQYLSPSRSHPQPDRWVHPDLFAAYADFARALGFARVDSGPLVRSSYHAKAP